MAAEEKTRSQWRLGLRAVRVSIVVKRFVSPVFLFVFVFVLVLVFVSFSRLCSLTIDSSNRGEVSTMVGVPIRISYSNADSIHGSIMGYEGEWRDHIHACTSSISLCVYTSCDSNREREREREREEDFCDTMASAACRVVHQTPRRRLFAQKRKPALTYTFEFPVYVSVKSFINYQLSRGANELRLSVCQFSY